MHILIIGAGASGLMAARLLAEKNHQVTVVEARDRIGGRIHTLTSGFSMSVEAGAEFVHGDLPITLSLVEESGSSVTEMNGNRYQFWKGQWQEGDEQEEDWAKLEEALSKLKTDTDMASFMKQHFDPTKYADLYARVKGFVEGYDIADLHRVSTLALKAEWANHSDDRQYRINDGYIPLLQFLEERIKAAGGKVILSSPIKEIQWAPGKVKIKTDGHVPIEADKVIVTVPLGVLQKGVISFYPPLPQQEQAFQQIGFGGVIKFLFEFKTAFWEDKVATPLHDMSFLISDEMVPTWWTQLPNKTPLLTGWLGGPSAFAASADTSELYYLALQSLERIFQYPIADIEQEVLHWHIANWLNDPHARGAYAYTTVTTPAARVALSVPVHNTIYFAGEALYEGAAMGTVEAALASGKGVAEQINEVSN